MPQLVFIALGAWSLLTVVLYRALPPRRAMLVSLVGGWILLPIADFPAGLAQGFGEQFVNASYPSPFFITKASVLGAANLLGLMLFHHRLLTALRPRWFDGPIIVYCMVPIATCMRNGIDWPAAVHLVGYQWLTWGAVYIAGRACLTSFDAMHEFALAVVAGALVCVPMCITELIAGPLFYDVLYGPDRHPWMGDGMVRWIGSRPIALFEHGNQMGIWMAGGALLAIWLWRSGAARFIGPIPMRTTAIVLTITTLAVQTVGPIALLALAGGLMCFAPKLSAGTRRVVLGALIVAAVSLTLMMTVAAGPTHRAAVKLLGQPRVDALRAEARLKSFGSRLTIAAPLGELVKRRPLLGYGTWNWWTQTRDAHGAISRPPWSLLYQSLGMYGLLGAAALAGTFATPIVMFARKHGTAAWLDPPRGAAAAVAMLLVITFMDNVVNQSFNLVLLAGAAGLSATCAQRASDDRASVHRAAG